METEGIYQGKQHRPITAKHDNVGLQFVDNRPLQLAQGTLSRAIQDGTAQLYSETPLNSKYWTDKMMEIRKREGLSAKSYLGHNVAFQSDAEANHARSKANGHAEGKVMNIFLAARGRKSKVDIITERQPCRDCEEDLRSIESVAKPALQIDTYYFIDYARGGGPEPLQAFYESAGWEF